MLKVVPEALLPLSTLMSFSPNAPEELRCVCEELLRAFRSPLKRIRHQSSYMGELSYYCIEG